MHKKGPPFPSHRGLRNLTDQVIPGSYYLQAPNGTYWACNTGLTPCISAVVLNQTSDYCVLVQVLPHITYHPSEDFLPSFDDNSRHKREPVTMTLALLLGIGGIAAGIGTGTSAYLKTGELGHLQASMAANLEALEKSVSTLEKSLTSLSEVVLQNRRGLDLLFLKEGGLCATLKEECCFYADPTGVGQETMAKLSERLAQRKRYFESEQNWFEGWFHRSPWSPQSWGPL